MILNLLERITSSHFPYDETHDLERVGFFMSIVPDGQALAIKDLLDKAQAAFSFVTHGKGTASKEIYDVLGIEENRKQIVFSLMPMKNWPNLKDQLVRRFKISDYTKGVACMVDIDSLSSVSVYRMVTNNRIDEPKKGKRPMDTEVTKPSDDFEIIMTIVNDGYSDIVMSAAKKAGARGGTILSARGTGNKDMEKFFGIVITPEKEIVMIIVPKDIKDNVLASISKECGINTKGQGIAFSLKASDVTGIVETEEPPKNN